MSALFYYSTMWIRRLNIKNTTPQILKLNAKENWTEIITDRPF